MRPKYRELMYASLDAAVNGAVVFLAVWAIMFQGGDHFLEAARVAVPLAVLRFVSYLKEETDWITLPQTEELRDRARSGSLQLGGRVRIGKFV